MALRSKSIRRRLTVRLLIGMLGLSVISNAALYIYVRGELFEQFDGALITEARAIAGALSSDEGNEEFASLISRSFPHMRLTAEDEGFLQVWDSSGKTVVRSASLKHHDVPTVALSARPDHPQVIDVTLHDGRPGRATSLTFDRQIDVDDPQRQTQTYRMTLAERRDELNYTLSNFALGLALIGGGLTAASVALLVWGVRREFKPLDEFSEQVSRVDASTLAYRFSEGDICDELAPISRRLNGLLERLDESFKRERRFSANVAHELRTPIAELRSMIEVAIRWPPEKEGRDRLHQHILEVAERMSRLVDAMLSLIRVQQGRQTQISGEYSLREIIDSAWKPHLALAARREVKCDFAVDVATNVHADRTMLEALIGNLLANAAQYATAGSTISCRSDASGSRLTISNATLELEPADLKRLDEPFWRKDRSRTPGDRLGLGLAIVSDYAAAMGIRCSFAMPSPGLFAAELAWTVDAVSDASVLDIAEGMDAETQSGDVSASPGTTKVAATTSRASEG